MELEVSQDLRSAVSKAGWRTVPLLGVGYLLAYMDRVNVSFASTQMNVDLGFSATIYGFGAGLFYLAYSLIEIPSNILLMRFGARRWLARIMIMWGLIAAATMFVRSPMQFYALRFMLGLAEAGFFPGVVYFLSSWFPTRQRGRAVALFYLANPLAVAVMGSISVPLLGLDGTLGLRGWQWLFVIEGLPAALVGVLVLLFLPDKPANAPWLTEGERSALQAAIDDHPERDAGHSAHGVLSVLKDRRVQLLTLIYLVTLSTSTTFLLSAPAILMELTAWKLPPVSTLILYAGLLGALTMFLTGWVTDRRGERFTALMLALTIDTAAYLVIALAPSPAVVAGTFVVAQIGRGMQSTAQAALWTDVLKHRGLAIGAATISSVANLGVFLLPFAFGAAKDHTGSYHLGLFAFPALHVFALLFAVLLWRNAVGRRRMMAS
ncbi:MAG: MFS transporter [Sphingomonadales bacterium]|nr:MFS transporter [Sphingomonadales bacterium]